MTSVLLDAAPDPVVAVDRAGLIVLANQEAERRFGYSRSELLGKPVESLIPERHRGGHADHRERYAKDPRSRSMATSGLLFARCKDGREIPVEISLSPVTTPEGVLVISIIRDVSERRAANEALEAKAEELRRRNVELEQFAHVASHDLQEPLRAITSACQLLERRYGHYFDADAKQFIGIAVEGAKRLQTMIVDLDRYTRVSARGKPPVPTDAQTVATAVLAKLAPEIADAGATVDCGLEARVLADPNQLGEMFEHLVGNALKFRGDETPRIEIRAHRSEPFWRFEVIDNGIGIDGRHHNKLFKMFSRLHALGLYPGTGTGLALCKKIVERHGGDIGLSSNAGQGTMVWFTLRAA